MANTRPFTDAHAIACVDVAVFFDDELPEGQLACLREAMQVALTRDGFNQRKTSSSPVTAWRKVNDDQESLEEFHVHSSFFHFSAYEYRGWSFTRDSIVNRLLPAFEQIRRLELTPLGIGLAFIDVFFNDMPSAYNVRDVFAAKSLYLPEVTSSSGRVWKSEISWIEDFRSSDVSNSLLIAAKFVPEEEDDDESEDELSEDEVEQHVTEITHKMSVLEDFKERDWTKEGVVKRLDLMHSRNKELLSGLLSEEMIARIGLKE